MRLNLQGVEISVESHVERSETEIVSAGAYVVAVTTVLERQGLLLASSYLADLAGRAAATHLWSARQAPRFDYAMLELVGAHCGRTCLLDHAARLRELLADELATTEVRVEITDAALSTTEDVWGV
jgi:hypothetical protein